MQLEGESQVTACPMWAKSSTNVPPEKPKIPQLTVCELHFFPNLCTIRQIDVTGRDALDTEIIGYVPMPDLECARKDTGTKQ